MLGRSVFYVLLSFVVFVIGTRLQNGGVQLLGIAIFTFGGFLFGLWVTLSSVNLLVSGLNGSGDEPNE